MPRSFKAATWNAYVGISTPRLEPTLEALLASGVSIILGQEMPRPEHGRLFKRAGLEVSHYADNLVAWRPGWWTTCSTGGGVLTETVTHSKTGRVQPANAAWAVLCDREGRSLEALSYHTPAGVQTQDPPARRLQVTQESMAALRARAKGNPARACLYGGDDNVDESWKWAARFAFMAGNSLLPLRQVQAPAGTLGPAPFHPHPGGRRVDDYRVKNLRPGSGAVWAAPGDHGIHVRNFRFAR